MPWCALSLQAPLRMEMKGVCNEFLSARVPDPAAISQLRGENQRDRERVERWGSEMKARRGSRENTGLSLFFFSSLHFFLTPPLLVPGCQAATMLSWPFFLVYGEQCGTVTWRQERRGERFWRGLGESGGEEKEKGGGQEGGQSKADLMRI